MTNFTLGRLLLVALAIVGLAFAAPGIGAHGNDTTADDTPRDNATAEERTTWMEAQMTDHTGPGSVEWMESHVGVTVDEMTQHMAGEEYHDGADEEYHDGADDDYDGRMYGQGHC